MKRVNVNEEALKTYYSTHTYVETLKEFNITGGVLDRRIKKWGIRHNTFKCKDAVEAVTKEDIIQYYIVENHSKVETREHFNITEWSLSKLFKQYGIVKPKDVLVQNRTVTKLSRYGNGLYNNRTKFKETCTKRYGGIGFASEECRAKSEATTEVRYGNADIRKTDYFKDKTAQTKLTRYGDPNYNNMDKQRQTCMSRYGVECYLISQDCYGKFKNDSKPNLAFAQLLTDNNIEFEREFPIENRSYDFKVGDILIEIDPFATHNSTWGIKGGEPKDPTYHVNKTILARENGYRCIHIWDWDDLDKVIQILKPKQKIYARKCTIKEIDQHTANKFLNQYHLQGGAKLQSVCAALYLGEELVQIMTFGKPRFNKHYQWELIRLCTKSEYMVVGGSDRLYKYFMNKYQPDSIISYCDMSKFSGNVYSQLGMELKSRNNPSRHWFNPETGRQLTDNGVRMLGFDKLCNASFGKGTCNDELLREHGWFEIWDAGQAVYTWNKA